MSIQKFINDPESYSKGHKVTFGAISAEAAGLRVRRQVKQSGWDAIQYETAPAHFTNFAFEGDTVLDDPVAKIKGWHVRLGTDAMHTVKGIPAYQDKGICFLPWGENAVTYMKIPAAAKTFFTGPLSGCSIYIGLGTDGSHWAFHANRNGIEGKQRNAAVKHSMTAVTATDIGVRVQHAALYGKQYHNYAFVFGQKTWRGRWTFHVADLAVGGPRCTVTALP